MFANAHFTGFLLCARDEGVLLQGAKKSPALEGFVVFDVGNMIAAPLQRPTSMSVDGPYEYSSSIGSQVWLSSII